LDLFTGFASPYNTCMKVFYLVSTAYIICAVRFGSSVKRTYKKGQDTFLHWEFAVIPSAILALITHVLDTGIIDIVELLWQFSIYLEVMAIVPQAIVSLRYSEAEHFAGFFMFFMGNYRALYIVNWIYRAHTERAYRHHYAVYTCGVAETLVYVVFFYFFCKRKWQTETIAPLEAVPFVESPDCYWYENRLSDREDETEADDDAVYVPIDGNEEGTPVPAVGDQPKSEPRSEPAVLEVSLGDES
jgi:ER lumen protein retaining receptor